MDGIPVPLDRFVHYFNEQCDKGLPTHSIIRPFLQYEELARKFFATETDSTPVVNCFPVFTISNGPILIRARQLRQEPIETQEKFLFPLEKDSRRADKSPAVVHSLKEFFTNWNVFTERCLEGLNWENVVAAGSSVAVPLLPVPQEHAVSIAARRIFYHKRFAPSSDIDLFLFGLDEQQALEKIREIEFCVRSNSLEQTTTVRSKHAITIVSKFPTRHVQIILRLYRSISEVLTGFDVDASSVAFDGCRVLSTPRGLAAFMTQINNVDLSRRSPSYEMRLAKYRLWGFEIFWSGLERSRVNPHIFYESEPINHLTGLARLLALEQLFNIAPCKTRPWPHLERGSSFSHAFWIPYGPKYDAVTIENVLLMAELSLNGRVQGRFQSTSRHRHLAFWGALDVIMGDCCGACPSNSNEPEEPFISGVVSFLKQNPGRQKLGSFHPLTAIDWTEMAYVACELD